MVYRQGERRRDTGGRGGRDRHDHLVGRARVVHGRRGAAVVTRRKREAEREAEPREHEDETSPHQRETSRVPMCEPKRIDPDESDPTPK